MFYLCWSAYKELTDTEKKVGEYDILVEGQKQQLSAFLKFSGETLYIKLRPKNCLYIV